MLDRIYFGASVEKEKASIAILDGSQGLDSATSTTFPHTGSVHETELQDQSPGSALLDDIGPVNLISTGSIAQVERQSDGATNWEENNTGLSHASDSVQDTAITRESLSAGPTTTHLFVRVHRERHLTCDPRCPCICHRERKGRTPDFLSGLVGRLFVGYSGTPIGSVHCSVRSCRNNVVFGAKVTYIFPQWFVGKSVSFILWKTQQAELSMLLKVRNYSPDEKIFHHLMVKDWTKVELLIQQERVSPNDVERVYGQTLMHVSPLFLSGIVSFFTAEADRWSTLAESA